MIYIPAIYQHKKDIFLLFFCFIVFLGTDMEKNWWAIHTHIFVRGLCIFVSWMNYVNDDKYVLCNLGLFQGLNTLFLKEPNTIWKFPTAKFCMVLNTLFLKQPNTIWNFLVQNSAWWYYWFFQFYLFHVYAIAANKLIDGQPAWSSCWRGKRWFTLV